MLERIGGRKLVLTVLLTGVAILLDRTVGLSDALKELLEVFAVTFGAGNALEHAAKNKMYVKPVVTPSVLQPNLTELHSKLDEIKAKAFAGNAEELKTKLQSLTNNAALNSQASSAIMSKLDAIAKAANLNV